MTVMFATVT